MLSQIKAALFIAIFVGSISQAKEYTFTGRPVWDEATGTYVKADDEKKLMAVSSKKHHYSLVLPYNNRSTIRVAEKGYVVWITAGLVNTTIEMSPKRYETTQDYLTALQGELEANKNKLGIEEMRIIEHRKDLILTNAVDVFTATKKQQFQGAKQINYYATKQWGAIRYILHVSRILDKGEQVDLSVTNYLDFLTVGFNVDHMRK